MLRLLTTNVSTDFELISTTEAGGVCDIYQENNFMV